MHRFSDARASHIAKSPLQNRPSHFARITVSLTDSEIQNVVNPGPLKWCQGLSGLVLCEYQSCSFSEPERRRALCCGLDRRKAAWVYCH